MSHGVTLELSIAKDYVGVNQRHSRIRSDPFDRISIYYLLSCKNSNVMSTVCWPYVPSDGAVPTGCPASPSSPPDQVAEREDW
jgi:hypothetical protein